MKLYTRPGSPAIYADMAHPATGKRLRFSTGHTDRRAAQGNRTGPNLPA